MSCTLRPLGSEDLDLICRHRREMFRSMSLDSDLIDEMEQPFRAWLLDELVSGGYFGFIACRDSEAVGGIGLMEITFPPHPLHPTTTKRGRILNLFVEPRLRGQGVARQLIKAAEDEFLRRDVNYLVLHASEMSRPIYEQDGWKGTAEMEKVLKAD
ncbi:MAG: GNAT family N-acetyltransferase [Roseibium sp.]|nr:GNAT family N-acetyltransferase [Roseibium sp.]